MTNYQQRVREMLDELGVTAEYIAGRGLTLYEEPPELAPAGLDLFGRERELAPGAARAWASLQAAAAADGITLLLVSAYRSLDYQRRVFVRKINEGTTLEEILAVNAPPGYSEHHSGRAIDLATPGSRPLTEDFETTPAFAWLSEHASRFGFSMSYPRGNAAGFVYEPWHWLYAAA